MNMIAGLAYVKKVRLESYETHSIYKSGNGLNCGYYCIEVDLYSRG